MVLFLQEISKLRMQRDALEDRLQHLEWTLRYKRVLWNNKCHQISHSQHIQLKKLQTVLFVSSSKTICTMSLCLRQFIHHISDLLIQVAISLSKFAIMNFPDLMTLQCRSDRSFERKLISCKVRGTRLENIIARHSGIATICFIKHGAS
jgi:hypothetical protein